MVSKLPCKTKTSQATARNLRKFLNLEENTKVIHTDDSLEFGRSLWRLPMESLNGYTSSTGDEWNCRKSSEKSQEGTLSILVQSGLDELWSAESLKCYCFLRNVQDLSADEKTPYQGRCEVLVWASHTYHSEQKSNIIQLQERSALGHFSGLRCVCGRKLERSRW